MRIVVTGAGGYIGPRVVQSLARLGHEVIPVVRAPHDSELLSGFDTVVVNVLDPDFDMSQFGSTVPDAIIHLAWQDGFVHDNPSHFENVSAHFKFIMSCADAGIKKISVLGTMHEIGYWEGPIGADTPTKPISLYGIAKDSLRRALIRSLPETSSLRWLRAYYILGDDDRNHSIFTKLLAADRRGELEFPFTTGMNQYDFINILDLANLISEFATTENLPAKSIINCGSGTPVQLKDKVEEFIAANNLTIRLKYGEFPDRPYDSPRVWGEKS